MDINNEKKIYKFMFINDFSRNVLRSNKFYFGDWKNMNDPMEGYFTYDPDEIIQHNLDDLKDKKNTYGICCFSNTYNQILMWSHYADNHQGICIEIEIDKKLCRNNKIDIQEIKYVKNIENIVGNNVELLDAKGLLSKKIDIWKYEKEIRLFCIGKKTTHKIGKITRILLGIRCDKKELIENYINGRNIKIIQTKINFKSNTINIR